MSQLKVLVVEDDQMIADSVKDILELLNHQVIGIAADAETAISLCNEYKPDIALLDIQIRGDINGVDLAELINDQFDIPFIFTTAFADTNTVTRASEKGPFGYLVKPYGVEEINAAIEVAKGAFDRLKSMEVKVGMSRVMDKSVFLKVNSKLVKVQIDDILYVESVKDYVLFKTLDKYYLVYSTMKNVDKKLCHFNFHKVHRSFIVNLAKIVDMEESNLLIDGKIIPISRSNKETLMGRLNLL